MNGRVRKPFATLERWQAGWYAVAKVGMCSGPWTDAEKGKAQEVVDAWNKATS